MAVSSGQHSWSAGSLPAVFSVVPHLPLCPATHHQHLGHPKCTSILYYPERLTPPFPHKWLRLCWLDKIVSGSCIPWPYSIPELLSYSEKQHSRDPFSLCLQKYLDMPECQGWALKFRLGTPPPPHLLVSGGMGMGAENPALALAWWDGTVLSTSSPSGALDQATQTPLPPLVPFIVNDLATLGSFLCRPYYGTLVKQLLKFSAGYYNKGG